MISVDTLIRILTPEQCLGLLCSLHRGGCVADSCGKKAEVLICCASEQRENPASTKIMDMNYDDEDERSFQENEDDQERDEEEDEFNERLRREYDSEGEDHVPPPHDEDEYEYDDDEEEVLAQQTDKNILSVLKVCLPPHFSVILLSTTNLIETRRDQSRMW
jgi:hypothetical protein